MTTAAFQHHWPNHSKWLSERAEQTVGRPLNKRTLIAHKSRIHSAETRATFLPGEPTLLDVLSDRESTTELLAMLKRELSSGSVRNTVQAVREYGAWAVECGLIDSCERTK